MRSSTKSLGFVSPEVADRSPAEGGSSNRQVPTSVVAPFKSANGLGFEKEPSNTGKRVALIGIGFVIIVLVGIVAATVGGGDDTVFADVELNTILELNEGDYVNLVFTSAPSEGALEAFSKAATTISAVVADTNLAARTVAQDSSLNNLCGVQILQNDFVFEGGTRIENLVIVVEPINIDGVGGTLAQAGFCIQSNGLPLIGLMQFDNADINQLEDEGILDDVILHEMLHVAGVGAAWGNLLQDPVFTGGVGDPNADPQFVGTGATDEFTVLSGANQNSVPVEDDGNGQFNVAQGEGQGSVDAHWRLSTFVNELMVFAINSNFDEHPLSRMTVASLEDIGYDVDFSVADDFALQTTFASKSLRGNGSGKSYDLSGDLIRVTPREFDDLFTDL